MPVREIKITRNFDQYREILNCDRNKIIPKQYKSFPILIRIREI